MMTAMEVLSSASEAVNDRVIISPGPARVSGDEIVTGLRFGAVVSMLTVVPCVTALTGVPTFAAMSLNVIVKATGPCGSVDATVILAVHVVPTHVTGAAERPAIVTAVLLSSSSDAVVYVGGGAESASMLCICTGHSARVWRPLIRRETCA